MNKRTYLMAEQTTMDPTSPEFPSYMFKALNKHICDEQFIWLRRETADVCSKIMTRSREKLMFYSGSFAEGFRLKTSDKDVMFSDNNLILVNDVTESHIQGEIIFLQMDSGQCRPGYTRLRLLNFDKKFHTDFERLATSDGFLRNSYILATRDLGDSFSLSGPSLMSDMGGKKWDFVFCIPCTTWPKCEIEFRTRSLKQRWPSPSVVEEIIQNGSHVVPVSSKFSHFEDSEWRISFSVAESRIVSTFNHTQFLCYGLLKLVLVHKINPVLKGLLCSYFIKTLILWEIQESENKVWVKENILQHFWKCLERLTRWVSEDKCPNFFIPENNMFSCRFNVKQQHDLLQFLQHLNEEGNWIFFEIPDLHSPYEITHNISLLNSSEVPNRECEQCLLEIEHTIESFCVDLSMLLTQVTNLQENKSTSEFAFLSIAVEECIIRRLLCKALTQFLFEGDQGNRQRYEIYRTQVRGYIQRLEGGSKTSMLWAATARYAIGQYNAAANIILTVKLLSSIQDDCLDTLTELNRTFLPVVLSNHFFLPELYPEVEASAQENTLCAIPPILYADWLLFMCYYHSKETRKRDAALGELHALLFDDSWNLSAPRDITLNLVGMCYEHCRNYKQASEMFRESLSNGRTFSTAALCRMQQLEHRVGQSNIKSWFDPISAHEVN